MKNLFKKRAKVDLKPREIGEYMLGETLGVGGYSKVKLGEHKETKQTVALKIMFADENGQISDSKLKQLKRELNVMKKVKHQNVIRFMGFYDEVMYPEVDGTHRRCIVTVLEYASGGELFDFLMFTGHFDETITRTYFHQLVDGLDAIHKEGIAHRDLKPENLLLDKDYVLKIADFGFATSFRGEDGQEIKLKTACGTKGYLAPELLRREKYSYPADIFAVGIILFTIYAGFPPFQNAVQSDWWWDKIEKRKYKLFWMAHERSRQFGDELKDLILRLLHPNPKKRLTLQQARQHQWYKGKVKDYKDLKPHLDQRRRVVLKKRVSKLKKQQEELGHGNKSLEKVRGEGGDDVILRRAKKLDPDNEYSKNVRAPPNVSYMYSFFQFVTKCPPRELAVRLETICKRSQATIQFDPFTTTTTIHTAAKLENNQQQKEDISFAVKQFKTADDYYLVTFNRLQGTALYYKRIASKFYDADELVEIMDTDYILEQLQDVKVEPDDEKNDN